MTTPRRDFGQLLADSRTVTVDGVDYRLAPLTCGDFGEFITEQRERALRDFRKVALGGGFDPRITADVCHRIAVDVYHDGRLLELAASPPCARWLVARSLKRGGCAQPEKVLDGLPLRELLMHALSVLEVSGLLALKPPGTDEPPADPTQTRAPTGASSPPSP